MRKNLAGYSLLEVLIAVCILSVSLLAFAQAQLTALRINQSTYLQTIAQTRLTSLAETLYTCNVVTCSSNNIMAKIKNWNELNQQLLPAGEGKLIKDNNYQIINVQWQRTDNKNTMQRAKLFFPHKNSY